MNKAKSFFTRIGLKAKHLVACAAASAMAAITCISACAEETGTTTLSTYSSQIIKQFTDAAADIVPIIIGVMGAGLTIFVIFLGIKFGKKMFNVVSK